MFSRTSLRPIALFTLLVQVLSVVFVGPGGGCCLQMWRCGAVGAEGSDAVDAVTLVDPTKPAGASEPAAEPLREVSQRCEAEVPACCASGCTRERFREPNPVGASIDQATRAAIDESSDNPSVASRAPSSRAFGDGRCDPNPLDDSAPCRIWLPDLAPGVVKELWCGARLAAMARASRAWHIDASWQIGWDVGGDGSQGWHGEWGNLLRLGDAGGDGEMRDATPTSHRGMTAVGEALRVTRLRV